MAISVSEAKLYKVNADEDQDLGPLKLLLALPA